jgi:hypothetical protein
LDSLRERIRTLSEHLDPESEGFWKEALTPVLPPEPLSRTFLAETLAPLSILKKAIALEFLARLGRGEVAEPAAELLKTGEARGIERIDLAVALARCRDPRGLAELEALFHHSLRHPDDKGNAVPLEWIVDDTLNDQLGTPEALELRRRLVAVINSSRSNGA